MRRGIGGTQQEFESFALEIRKMAGLGDEELTLATRMAARLLGPDAVALDPTMSSAAYLRRVEGGWQIVVNPNAQDLRFNVAHEIGEWALRTVAQFQGSPEARERAANRIAAALLAPAKVVRLATAMGERLPELADGFGLSQTAMVLRLAEVRGDERAVVTRTGNVILRTQGAFPWAEVPVVDVARGRRWAGLRKATLAGGIDHGRVALIAR